VASSSSFVRQKTPVPQPQEVINAGNSAQLAELARWGKGEVKSVVFSPDGRQAGVATSEGVYIYDAVNFKLLNYYPLQTYSQPVQLFPTLNRLVTTGKSDEVIIVDVETRQTLTTYTYPNSNEIDNFSITPDGETLLIGQYYYDALHLNDGKIEHSDAEIDYPLAFSADGNTVAWWEYTNQPTVFVQRTFPSIEENKVNFKVWQSSDPNQYSQLGLGAFSDDGSLLALGYDFLPRILVYRLGDKAMISEIVIGRATISHKIRCIGIHGDGGPGPNHFRKLAFTPDRKAIVALTGWGELLVYSLDGTLLARIPNTDDDFTISPGGKTLVTWGDSVHFYSLPDLQELAALGDTMGNIFDVVFSPDSRSLALTSDDGKVWLRQVVDGAFTRTFEGFQTCPTKVLFYPDGKQLLTTTIGGEIWLWNVDLSVGKRIERYYKEWGRPFDIRYLSFSPVTNTLVVSSDTMWGAFELLNLDTGAGRTDLVTYGSALSPSGEWLAYFASEDNTHIFNNDYLRLRNLNSEEVFSYYIIPPSDNWFPPQIIFSPDSKLLAVRGDSFIYLLQIPDEDYRSPFLFDSTFFRDVEELRSYYLTTHLLEFSPDSSLLASYEPAEQAVILWDLSQYPPPALVRINIAANALAFSPDGRFLAVADETNTIHLYGIPPQE
jgi:WD40 repeat protein